MQWKSVPSTASLDTKFKAIQKWIVRNVHLFTNQLRVIDVSTVEFLGVLSDTTVDLLL